MTVMKKLITNVTAGLLLGGIGAGNPTAPKEPVAPPDTPHVKKLADEKLAPAKTLTRIQPTKEGEETIKRLAAQGQDLLKAPTPTGETRVGEKNIEWLGSVIKDLPGASLKKVDENGYHHALVIAKENKKEEVWYIRSIGVTGPVFFMGFGGGWGFTFINKEDPQAIAVYEGDSKLDKAGLLNILDEARHNAAGQKNDPAGAKKFDLTKKRPIGYLCFNGFDESDKQSRQQYYEYSHALPELLNSCGYDMVCLDNKKRITELQKMPNPDAVTALVANPSLSGIATFAATPFESNAKLVERQVEALHRQGVRDFYLNFLTHGDRKEGMKAYDGSWFKGDDLKDILLKYGDCRFTIDATGCEGGGLIGMMRNFKDAADAPEGRVGVFVHTKEDFWTLSHDYQSLLVKVLADMASGAKDAPQTYGEAAYRADLERRRLTNGRHDPEFWKSMPGQPSIRTAQNDTSRPARPQDAAAFAALTDARREWAEKLKYDDEPKGRC